MNPTEFFQPSGDPQNPDAWKYHVAGCNTMKVYGSYKEYFLRIAGLLRSLSRGDVAHFSGWEFSDKLELIQGDSSSQFDALVKNAVSNQATVRFIATKIPNDPTIAFNAFAKGGAVTLIDTQIYESHAKVAFFRTSALRVIFVGGMDLADGRANLWHDVQVELDGDAADLGLALLEERWFSVYNEVRARAITYRSNLRRGRLGEVFPYYVQFLRTCTPTTSSTRSYAVKGDFSYYSGLFRALTKCESSIYVEDQSIMSVSQLPQQAALSNSTHATLRHEIPSNSRPLDVTFSDALAKVRANGKVCKVYVSGGWAVSGHTPDPFRSNRVQRVLKIRGDMVLPKQTPPGRKLTYIHSKAWVFDDQFLVIGSANYWEPSFDAIDEMGVAILLPHKTLGRNIRLQLWQRIRSTFDPADAELQSSSSSFAEDVTHFEHEVTNEKIFFTV